MLCLCIVLCRILDVVLALFTYSSNEPGDLSFNHGNLITVIKTEGEWWTGTLDGKTGIFPANYVQKIEIAVGSSSVF